jgi:hypothetical protein
VTNEDDVANPGDGNTYTATYTVDADDTDGAVGFSISFSDTAGNAGDAVTAVTDSSGVTVDNTAPVITLTGNNPQTVERLTSYSESSATVADDIDQNAQDTLTIDSSNVSTSVSGSYSVTYDATDAAGNAAQQVTRTVNVVDTTAPTLTSVSIASNGNSDGTLAKADTGSNPYFHF